MTDPQTNGSAPPAPACPGQHGMAVPAGVSDSGAPQRAVNPGPVARLCSGAAQDRGGNSDAQSVHSSLRIDHAECARDRAQPFLLALPETTPAASAVGGFSDELLKAERLVLLMDAHRARRRHASTQGIMRKLRGVTARLAMIGG